MFDLPFKDIFVSLAVIYMCILLHDLIRELKRYNDLLEKALKKNLEIIYVGDK